MANRCPACYCNYQDAKHTSYSFVHLFLGETSSLVTALDTVLVEPLSTKHKPHCRRICTPTHTRWGIKHGLKWPPNTPRKTLGPPHWPHYFLQKGIASRAEQVLARNNIIVDIAEFHKNGFGIVRNFASEVCLHAAILPSRKTTTYLNGLLFLKKSIVAIWPRFVHRLNAMRCGRQCTV